MLVVVLVLISSTEETHDLIDVVYYKMVHHPLCQYDPVSDAITALGRLLP